MKVLGFAASNSKNSINKQLIEYILSKLIGVKELVDITVYEMPIYSFDYESDEGVPTQAKEFLDKISGFDLIIISHAEHNSNFSSYYKNLLDWCSRVSIDVFQNKKLVLLATSPGMRGGKNVLEIAKSTSKIFNGQVCFSMSIPDFYNKFQAGKIIDETIRGQLFGQLKQLGLKFDEQ